MPKFPDDNERWVVVRDLGEGGQGTVFLARTREASSRLNGYLDALLLYLSHVRPEVMHAPPDDAGNLTLAKNIVTVITMYADETKTAGLGAFKQFRIPGTEPEATRTEQRIEREVQILRQTNHPSIIKLLDADVRRHWMVTEYHQGGTLANHYEKYKGDAGRALEAFRSLVEAVSLLHQNGAIHRDIKPQNIFVASNGRLVLGDFGIVFYEDEQGQRLTTTFERVGARDWMPPWAHTGRRLEDVKPSFDVFMLGKVLWCMVSGERFLPLWYWNRDEYNLEKLFPKDIDMPLVNSILKRCVVEDEEKCLPSASTLLEHVDEALRILNFGGHLLEEGVPRPCRVCGRGRYEPKNQNLTLSFAGEPVMFRVFSCNHCGHTQIFRVR